MKQKQKSIVIATNELESSKRDYLFFLVDCQLWHVPSFHDSHELIYVLEGEGTATISGQTYPLRAGDICFINPNQVHYYDAAWGEIKAIVLLMGRDYSHHLRALHGKKVFPNMMLDRDKNERILKALEEWLPKQEQGFLVNCGYANILFDVLVREYGVEEFSPEYESKQQAFQFLSYIQENYNKNITLESVATHFAYSKEYFCSLFNKLVGQSFLTVLNLTRMEKAVEMLNDPLNKKSVERISAECGYSSTATFYRQYKAYLASKHEE